MMRYRGARLPAVQAAPALKRKLDYMLYKHGRQDGESGRPLGNLSDVYLQGYILGQAKRPKARS
jgi:hypothetical protein